MVLPARLPVDLTVCVPVYFAAHSITLCLLAFEKALDKPDGLSCKTLIRAMANVGRRLNDDEVCGLVSAHAFPPHSPPSPQMVVVVME